jgi:TPR repeat protein
MAMGKEAFKWAALAASQGDGCRQSVLAEIYSDGKITKQDLIEAFKWGDLAARNPNTGLITSTVAGRGVRDAAALKMSADQIAEARKRVAAFVPHVISKQEMLVKEIRLSGLSGPATNRLAVINDKTFSKGETASIKTAGSSIKIHCLEIRDKSVLVEIEGISTPRELSLNNNMNVE